MNFVVIKLQGFSTSWELRAPEMVLGYIKVGIFFYYSRGSPGTLFNIIAHT